MILAELIEHETGFSRENIMLLRHPKAVEDELQRYGSSIDEFSSLQPSLTKYDYRHPARSADRIVVVIVGDNVNAVYEVIGVEQEGTTYSLAGRGHIGPPPVARTHSIGIIQLSEVSHATTKSVFR